MNALSQMKRTILFGLLSLAALGMAIGCQQQKPKPEQPFFEKWRATAEKSPGYSPSQNRRPVDIGGGAEKAEEALAAGADLPDQPVTLKMHNVEVAVLLRALAKAAGQDIIINENVEGRVNIDVEEAPWNRVFMSILNARGLAYEKDEQILRIITLEDRSRSLQQLETEQKIKNKKREIELVDPLITKVVKIDYADAAQLKSNLEKFLTERQEGKKIGAVMVDEHTNSLIIQAIKDDVEKMIPIINELDRPTPQVLIEAHIVEATQSTARQLGIRWGGLYSNPPNYYATGGQSGDTGVIGVTPGNIDPITGYAVNFPAEAVTDALGMTVGFVAQDIGDSVLALQLSALEQEGELNILSSPSITTLDNQKAMIESGKEVPYQTVEDQEVKIEYKKAVLSLEVTPHVIGGKTLKLTINTNKDELDFANAVGGNPAITTKKARTTVIVFDGQTTVIGGLSKEDNAKNERGVPWFRKIPVFGWLFKGEDKDYLKDELLIFITPHILKKRPEEPPGE
jgi:type IV pilus assembly protein PilQ